MSKGKRSRDGGAERQYVAMVLIGGAWSAEVRWIARDRESVFEDLRNMCSGSRGLVRLYSRRKWGSWRRERGWYMP